MCPRNSSFEHIDIYDYAINGLFFTATSWAKHIVTQQIDLHRANPIVAKVTLATSKTHYSAPIIMRQISKRCPYLHSQGTTNQTMFQGQ
jgi:hypothetical protein